MKIHYRISREWLVPVGLILLVIVPSFAGTVRLAELGSGEVTAENARFFAAPLPVVVHIIAVVIYSILGALQFVPTFRQKRGGWHRMAGRILVPCGLISALTGLWMSHFYELPSHDGELLYWIRMVVGVAMFVFLVLGVITIQQRNFAAHGAWMTRAYALGMGAGTQFVLIGPWIALYGMPDTFPRAILMGMAWLINVLVAEWVIYSRKARVQKGASSVPA